MSRSRKIAGVLGLIGWLFLALSVVVTYFKRQEWETHATVYIRNSTDDPLTKVVVGSDPNASVTFENIAPYSMSKAVTLGQFKESHRAVVVERASKATLTFGAGDIPFLEPGRYKFKLGERGDVVTIESVRAWGP